MKQKLIKDNQENSEDNQEDEKEPTLDKKVKQEHHSSALEYLIQNQ
jgi:hypothetical protein